MPKQRGMPLPPESDNASLLLYSRGAQLGFVQWIDAKQQLKKRKSGCLSLLGREDLCEEYKSCHVRTGRLVLVGQSDPLFVPKSSLMKTPTPSIDDPAQEDLLQKYQKTSGKAITTK